MGQRPPDGSGGTGWYPPPAVRPGRSISITHRRIKNDRLAAVGFVWAFVATSNSPGARRHYDRRREHGDRHATALRHLFNRFLGCLHHCLSTGQTYDENTAFPAPIAAAAPAVSG